MVSKDLYVGTMESAFSSTKTSSRVELSTNSLVDVFGQRVYLWNRALVLRAASV